MKNAEAIETLRANYPDACFEQLREAVDAAIEALKAQLSQEGTTSDLISRQAARHALCKAVHKGEDIPCENQTASCLWTGTRVCDFVREIDALPTIHPEERTEAHACDLISRKATIDAVNNAFDRETLLTGFVRSIAVRAIRDMPSVQPEPTDINAREAVYNLAEKIGIHQLFALTVELRGEPIQPEPQWIPVSEKLPEDLAEVITTWVNRDPLPYYEFMRDKPFTAVSVHYKGEWYWYSSTCADYLEEYGRSDRDKVDKSIEIIAWMPLPEAYKPNK